MAKIEIKGVYDVLPGMDGFLAPILEIGNRQLMQNISNYQVEEIEELEEEELEKEFIVSDFQLLDDARSLDEPIYAFRSKDTIHVGTKKSIETKINEFFSNVNDDVYIDKPYLLKAMAEFVGNAAFIQLASEKIERGIKSIKVIIESVQIEDFPKVEPGTKDKICS
ncbi:MAG: hypothetical protein R8G66_01280 [Cytophagales bacterium]|nr:hypothetical protein [Cytophagales bacterium]